jgi:hypothetical protein
MQRLDSFQPTACNAPLGAGEHVGAEVDADDPVVPLVERQRYAGADADLEDPSGR